MRAETDFRTTFRRRRLVGLALLVVILVGSARVEAWRFSPLWAIFTSDSGTFTAGDPFGEWVYAQCDGEQQQVAVLRNGQLEGVRALESLRTVRFPDWCGLPTVDHPNLAEWQAQLRRVRELTTAPETSAADILAIARSLPAPGFYLEPMLQWVRADAEHAAAFLDVLAPHPAGRPASLPMPFVPWGEASRLTQAALDTVTPSVLSPERLSAWLATPHIAQSGRSLQRLADLAELDDRSRAALLERIRAVPMQERTELYSTLAPHLVSRPEYSALLAEQLRHLLPDARLSAVRQVLARPDMSVEFPIALLSSTRHLFHHPDAHLDVFIRIADLIRNEPDAPLLLTRHLREIQGMQRRLAATHLLTLDEPGETAFALATLRSIADLHPMSRQKFIYSVMHSEQFADKRVQEACLLAVRLELQGSEKRQLLSEMLRHQALDDTLHSRISAELG